MMTFLHGSPYHKKHVSTIKEFSCIQPHGIYRWMTYKAYGSNNSSPDNNPMEGWSTSLKYYKKRISHLTPNCWFD
eukprot:12406160-Ditylum_brightwellii.AAC.1